VLCISGLIWIVEIALIKASRQTQMKLTSQSIGQVARLRLPVSTGFMFDFTFTELP
jgi:hypothetical protein